MHYGNEKRGNSLFLESRATLKSKCPELLLFIKLTIPVTEAVVEEYAIVNSGTMSGGSQLST